jgi:hypothetical protein
MRSTDFLASGDAISPPGGPEDGETVMPESTATPDALWLARIESYASKADARHIPSRKIFVEKAKALRAEAMARKAGE